MAYRLQYFLWAIGGCPPFRYGGSLVHHEAPVVHGAAATPTRSGDSRMRTSQPPQNVICSARQHDRGIRWIGHETLVVPKGESELVSNGFTVVMTRTGDATLGNTDRATICNANGATSVLSIQMLITWRARPTPIRVSPKLAPRNLPRDCCSRRQLRRHSPRPSSC